MCGANSVRETCLKHWNNSQDTEAGKAHSERKVEWDRVRYRKREKFVVKREGEREKRDLLLRMYCYYPEGQSQISVPLQRPGPLHMRGSSPHVLLIWTRVQ